MTREPVKPPPERGDTISFTTRSPHSFVVDGVRLTSEYGEWVVITRVWTENVNGDMWWCNQDMRPATHDEIEEALGPVRWWQLRRKRQLRTRIPRVTLLPQVGPVQGPRGTKSDG